ncbi:acyl-CoA dehydrogenase family protein [Saccharopolyspora sp. NPDC000995]
MKFAVSNEQRQFATSLRDLLSEADTPAAIRAWADGRHEPGVKLWRGLSDLGVAGLLVPERFDGLEADAADAVVAFEALGYHCVPGPIVETAVVVPAVLSALVDDGAAERWLPRIAAGQSFATVLAPPHVPLALDADVADFLLCLRGAVIEESPGVETDVIRSVDAARRLFRTRGDALPLAEDVTVAKRAFDLGVLAVAAQLLGAGRWLLDAANSYAQQRFQYGKPIGQYQAIKHLLADVVTKLELARPLLYGAAVAVQASSGTVSRDVSAAKAAAGEAAYLAARTALQVHGAIGYTAEHNLGLWLTKIRALTGSWGGASFHRKRVLDELQNRG